MRIKYLAAIIVLVTVGTASYQSSGHSITDNEQIVTARYGETIEVQVEPDGHFKMPVIHRIDYDQKNIHITRFSHEVPTLDKKYLLLKIQAFWKISDSMKYNENFSNFNEAKNLVWDSAEEAVRRVIITYEIKDVLKETDKSIEKSQCSRDIELEIIQLTNNYISKKGIEILNIDIRINSQPIRSPKLDVINGSTFTDGLLWRLILS